MVNRTTKRHVNLTANNATFTFELFCKPLTLGQVSMDQYWLQTTQLYAQVGKPHPNHTNLVEWYRSYCIEQSAFEGPATEVYLLCRLLPHLRSRGSRKVFLDSVPSIKSRRDAFAADEKFANLISSTTVESTTIEQFYEATADILRLPHVSQEVRDAYNDFVHRLFRQSLRLLPNDPNGAVAAALNEWRRVAKIGRRSGQTTSRMALDLISYEGRAALHQAYSALWCELIKFLRSDPDSDFERFHSLWHLDRRWESNDSRAHYHLFHGHILALHPIGGILMTCEPVRALLGEWLIEQRQYPQAFAPSFERVLYAVQLACYYYEGRYELTASQRKR